MSFRDLQLDGVQEEDGAADLAIQEGLVALQASVHNTTDQISRLSKEPLLPRSLATMKLLLEESSNRVGQLEAAFAQWKTNSVDDFAATMRRKLLLPKLESAFLEEAEKLKLSRESVKQMEKQLSSFQNGFSSQMVQFSTLSEVNDLTDLPLDSSSAWPPATAEPQPDFLGRLVPPPIAVDHHFYGDEEETRLHVKKNMSSTSSTTTGGSGSPVTEDRARIMHDSFLEDDYKDSPQPEEDEELLGLLSRGSERSAAYLDGWQISAQRENDELPLYISRERLRGVERIKAQLSQAAVVFKELAQLINQQQEDFNLIDTNMMNTKNATGSALVELRKANMLKQQARRRNMFFILLTLIAGGIILFVYSLQGSRQSSPPPAFRSALQLAGRDQTKNQDLFHPGPL